MSLLNDKKRLVLEVMSMKERWKDVPVLHVDGNTFWWSYAVHLEGNKFNIKIVYPDEYPKNAPSIYIVDQLKGYRGMAVPHRTDGNYICWKYSESKRNRNIWNPTRDTAAVCIGVAYRWFATYLVWQATGEWVVPDAKEIDD